MFPAQAPSIVCIKIANVAVCLSKVMKRFLHSVHSILQLINDGEKRICKLGVSIVLERASCGRDLSIITLSYSNRHNKLIKNRPIRLDGLASKLKDSVCLSQGIETMLCVILPNIICFTFLDEEGIQEKSRYYFIFSLRKWLELHVVQ